MRDGQKDKHKRRLALDREFKIQLSCLKLLVDNKCKINLFLILPESPPNTNLRKANFCTR